MSNLEILLYNKVELDDGSQGVVRYMGNIMGKKGVFYGIDITKGDAKNDGTFKKVKYFDTKKGLKTGRFCKSNKIVKCKKSTFSKYPFKLGQNVMHTKTKCKATVKYVGVPSWVKGGKVYYGLELTKKKGTCNGTMNGIQYFESKKNFGIYVPAKDVTKVKKKKKKDDDEKKEEIDVRDHIKGYYRSKSGNKLLPESIKTSKKKKEKTKKAKKINKQPPSEPSYLSARRSSIEAQPSTTPQPPDMMPIKPRASVDYMDEEKDGIDLEQYTAKTEQMDYENNERQRHEQIQKMKQMEREDKLRREEEQKQALREKEERQRKQQQVRDKKNEERTQELSRTERQLRDKEKLEKYRKAIQDRENSDKQQEKEAEQLAATRKKNEMIKQQQMEEKRAKEEAERKEIEEQQQLAAKLRKEKEAKLKAQQEERSRKEKDAKMKEEEEKKSQSIVSNGSSGSIKDRMAMFQKKSSNTTTKKASTPVKYATNKAVQKPSAVASKSNFGVGSDKAINFEMTESFGKPLNKIKTTKVAGYTGEIPLVLYLLGQKLVKLDKFGTFKIFHPEQMEKERDKAEMQLAHNIFTFFADLPTPLLGTVPQSVLDKAINKDVMKDVVAVMGEPHASTLTYLWDILAKVAMNPNARMGGQSLGKVFGPMCTLVTQQDIKGNRVSMNALAASRMMAFFRRGIEWRMETQGHNFEDSDDSD